MVGKWWRRRKPPATAGPEPVVFEFAIPVDGLETVDELRDVVRAHLGEFGVDGDLADAMADLIAADAAEEHGMADSEEEPLW